MLEPEAIHQGVQKTFSLPRQYLAKLGRAHYEWYL